MGYTDGHTEEPREYLERVAVGINGELVAFGTSNDGYGERTAYAAIREDDGLTRAYSTSYSYSAHSRTYCYGGGWNEGDTCGDRKTPAEVIHALSDVDASYPHLSKEKREQIKERRAQALTAARNASRTAKPGDTLIFAEALRFKGGRTFDRFTLIDGKRRLARPTNDPSGLYRLPVGWKSRDVEIIAA